MVFNYPTLSECYKYAAYDALGPSREEGWKTGVVGVRPRRTKASSIMSDRVITMPPTLDEADACPTVPREFRRASARCRRADYDRVVQVVDHWWERPHRRCSPTRCSIYEFGKYAKRGRGRLAGGKLVGFMLWFMRPGER